VTNPNLNQVEINYQAFEKKLPSLIPDYRGKFALMRNEEIIEFFDTARDAYFAGKKIFEKDKLFSVQQVVDTPIDLGFFSHAIPQRKV
jgi:hypothetical protein